MADIQSLINGIKAAVNPVTPATVPITPAALGPGSALQFITLDDVHVPPGGFSTIYSFGDSLSDAGNISLGSDLPSQVGQFVASVPHPSPTALYTVWAGSNDLLDIANSAQTPEEQQATVQQAVNNEVGSIDGLIAHGAKDLVVMSVPDLAVTPYEKARPASDATSSALSQTYNNELGAALQAIMASGAASIDYVNTYAMLDAAVASPATYGFSNVTQPVWNGNLTSSSSGMLAATGAAQSGYLFFDNLHPTAAGHALLAAGVTQSLTGTA
jgi:phospholipase/lecithinase/hemolysin